MQKYSNMMSWYIFEPFKVETFGSWDPSARLLFEEIAKRLVGLIRDQSAKP